MSVCMCQGYVQCMLTLMTFLSLITIFLMSNRRLSFSYACIYTYECICEYIGHRRREYHYILYYYTVHIYDVKNPVVYYTLHNTHYTLIFLITLYEYYTMYTCTLSHTTCLSSGPYSSSGCRVYTIRKGPLQRVYGTRQRRVSMIQCSFTLRVIHSNSEYIHVMGIVACMHDVIHIHTSHIPHQMLSVHRQQKL